MSPDNEKLKRRSLPESLVNLPTSLAANRPIIEQGPASYQDEPAPVKKGIGGRKPMAEDKKAVSYSFSLKPNVMRAIERYAEETDTGMSQVVNLAVHQLIPKEFFND